MNQIIFPEKLEITSPKKNHYITKYKITFFLSIFVIIIFLVYYIISYININNKAKISSQILNAYDIQSLYSSNASFTPSIILENGESSEILGIIEIKKLNLRYPILADYSEELLKVAPCKFYGESFYKSGNVCIAGHNYDNGDFFSNLYQLEIGDIINIYTMSGTEIVYTIYDKFESNPTNVSCLNQDTNFKEITLITCNNFNKKRLIIKAKNR